MLTSSELNNSQLTMVWRMHISSTIKCLQIIGRYPQVFIRKLSKMSGPIEKAITETLKDNLNPIHLEVINESYMHNVPKGTESHFKVLVVSEKFENIPLIKRHRMINDLVKQKLEGDFVHALSIVAKTPSQWDPEYKVEPSPECRGGFGK